jgi:hypothetical protein
MAQDWAAIWEKYHPDRQKHIDIVASLATAPTHDWTFVHDENDIRVWRKPCFDWTVHCVRGETIMQAPMETVFAIASNGNKRHEWDENCLECSTLQECNQFPNSNLRVDYLATKRILTVSSRDMLFAFTWAKPFNSPQTCITTSWSIDESDTTFDPHMHPRKGRVRGHVHVGGLYMEAVEENKTKVIYIASANPKGWLPIGLVNSASAKGAQCLASIRRAAEAKHNQHSKQ